MKFIAPLLVVISLVLVGFTDPAGHKTYVSPSQVITVTSPNGCADPSRTKINVGNGAFICVRETIEQVIEALAAK